MFGASGAIYRFRDVHPRRAPPSACRVEKLIAVLRARGKSASRCGRVGRDPNDLSQKRRAECPPQVLKGRLSSMSVSTCRGAADREAERARPSTANFGLARRRLKPISAQRPTRAPNPAGTCLSQRTNRAVAAMRLACWGRGPGDSFPARDRTSPLARRGNPPDAEQHLHADPIHQRHQALGALAGRSPRRHGPSAWPSSTAWPAGPATRRSAACMTRETSSS
jgi:hypothetical protein